MSTKICRGFTDDQWRGLQKRLIQNHDLQNDAAAWDCAVSVFERRIRERFLSCIEALEKADSKAADDELAIDAPSDCSTLPKDGDTNVVPGFAIMALCCLLTETLARFREPAPQGTQAAGPCTYPAGKCIKPKQSGAGSELIKNFLQRRSFGGAFKDSKVAQRFVDEIRNGLFHEAETRHWVIKRKKPKDAIIKREGKQYFLNRTEFFHALRNEFEAYITELRDPQKTGLRNHFITKMDGIVNKC